MNLVPDDVAAAIDFHHAGLHEAIDVGIQAAETGRQLRREHMDGPLGEVHGGPPLVRLLVECDPFLHIVRDVGDVHSQPHMAVLQPLDRDRVVEIPRVLAVDGDGLCAPEVGAPADVALVHGGADAPRLLDGLVGVGVGDIEFPDDDPRVDACLLDASEHFRHTTDRTARRRGPSGDLHEHHVARLGGRRLPGGDVDVGEHPPVERHHVSETVAVHLEASDEAFLAALEDPDDAPFEAFRRLALRTRDHAVAMHGFRQVRRRNVDVLAVAAVGVLGHDEPEPAGIRGQPADDEIHLLGQAEPVAADLEQLAGRDQRFQLSLERGPLFAWDAKRLRELSRSGGMVNVVADEVQKIVALMHRSNRTRIYSFSRSGQFAHDALNSRRESPADPRRSCR